LKKKNKQRELQVKYKIVSYLFFFIAMVVSISSCQNRPKEVLNRKNMERLLYDVYVAEATMENDYQHFDTPEKKEAYINEVFKIHKVTQAQWDTSLSWYSDRIDLYLKMNDSVKARLERARKETDLKVTQQNAERQIDPAFYSASYIPRVYTFFNPDTTKEFSFLLDSTEISAKIPEEQFSFRFSVIGIPPEFNAPLSSVLMLEYADTTIFQSQQISENGSYKLIATKFTADDTLSQINGFVHVQDPLGVVSNIRLYNISLGNDSSATVETSLPQATPTRRNRDLLTTDSVQLMR